MMVCDRHSSKDERAVEATKHVEVTYQVDENLVAGYDVCDDCYLELSMWLDGKGAFVLEKATASEDNSTGKQRDALRSHG